MNHRGYLAVIAVLILGGILATYSNHFHNDFHFDDSHTIEDNGYIRDLKNIPLFFKDVTTSSSMPTHQGYRPLVTTTLAIDYALSMKSTGGKNGYDTFWYHLSNFSWFVFIIILIYFIQIRLYRKAFEQPYNQYFTLLGCAWYGFTTANAETVNYIISRSDILSTLATVASVAIYAYWETGRKYFLFIIPAAIGMFAKETTIMVAPVLIAYDYIIEKDKSLMDLFTLKGLSAFLWSMLYGLPVLIICALLAYLSIHMTQVFETYNTTAMWYRLTQPYIVLHYVTQFILPFGLTADTDLPLIVSRSDDRLFIGFAFVLTLVVLIFKASASKQWRPFAYGLIWFLLMLLPTSWVALSEVTNDHRVFLPYIGLVFSMVCLIGNLYCYVLNNMKIVKYAMITILIFVISAYAYGTHQRNIVWQKDESLWKDVSEKSPHNGRGWMNYGLTLMGRGDYADAQYAYEQALIYTPNYYILHINIGVLKEATGHKVEAEQCYKDAIRFGPGYVESYYYYARYLFNSGRMDEAEVNCGTALQKFSGHIYSRYLLMDIYNYKKEWANLLSTANATLAMYPGDSKAQMYVKIASNPSSMPTTVESKNMTAADLLNQSLAMYYAGRYQECVSTCYRALIIKPDFSEAYNNMGTAYNQMQKYDSAIWACSKAVELKPDFQLAKNNLAWAKSQLKLKGK